MFSKLLKEKFQMSTHRDVKAWKDSTRCPLSNETVSKVLLRGFEPSVPTFITMAYYLGFTPSEIAAACKASGDTLYYRLIAPLELDDTDREILDLTRELSDGKKKLVIELLKSMSE